MDKKYVIVSGGFDPIHSGHVRLINDASKYGSVIVIINSDDFLLEKKGYAFMSVEERVDIIKNIKNVSLVFISVDNDHTVSKTIEKICNETNYDISFFANGGDRKNISDIPESNVCKKYKIDLIFDIGGGKTQSSSSLAQNAHDKMLAKEGNFRIIQKPWGYYKSFISEKNYLLKKIVINEKEELSLQSHDYRDEHWVVVSGKITAELNGKTTSLKTKDHLFIPKKSIHKILNPYDEKATIIEIQFGNILNESDITRFSDKYGRHES